MTQDTNTASGAADLPEALRPVEPVALIASIQELNAWEARADGELLTPAEGESIILVLHELKRLLALAAGQATTAQAVVPAGWNLVPTEPTQAMLDAVVTSMDDFLLGKEAEKQYREDWAAMLAAAPAQPVAEPSYEHQRAIMEGERNASLDAYSRVIYLTGAESQLYEAGFTNGWQRASHGQAPATQHPEGDVVAYLDVGASGYLDLGAALSEDALQQLPKGRHALVIAGTYGIDGYVAAPQPSHMAQAVAGEPDFYTACAWYEGGGEAGWIPLPGYSNETEHGVRHLVLEAARKEGYKGTAAGRLLELGWEIRPVYLTPQPTQTQAVPLTCEWTHNDDDGFWETACGEAWRFDDGGPGENSMHFCHSCGKSLRIKGGQHGTE